MKCFDAVAPRAKSALAEQEAKEKRENWFGFSRPPKAGHEAEGIRETSTAHASGRAQNGVDPAGDYAVATPSDWGI